MSAQRTVTTLLVSAGAAAAVRRLPEPAIAGWRRSNFDGRTVSLSGGLAAAAGALAGAAVSGPLARPALIASTSALLAGGYDDLMAPRAEGAADKGLAGHVRALRAGRISGGAVKVALIGAGSLAAAAALPTRSGWCSRLGSAALIAGTANVLNLFDLRPGRATKVALAIATPALVAGDPGPLAAVTGAGLMTLPDDLGERTMLGDLGANTLGALIGVRLAAGSTPVRVVAGVMMAGLTLASERVSFTRIIAATGPLRWLDELGRRSVPPPT